MEAEIQPTSSSRPGRAGPADQLQPTSSPAAAAQVLPDDEAQGDDQGDEGQGDRSENKSQRDSSAAVRDPANMGARATKSGRVCGTDFARGL